MKYTLNIKLEKQKVLENLRLVNDEPAKKSELFHFSEFAKQITTLLQNEQLPTPYSIVIHGEWGSGKTSLLRQAFEMLQRNIRNKDWRVMWFDAWEYERLDPTLALMQKIANEFTTKSKFVKALKALLLVSSDIALRRTVQLDLDEVHRRFNDSVSKISTITEELEKMIGKKRMIVFIDDLDRCSIENILNILEAIKMFFNAKGAVFVFAVDMSKIESAWETKHIPSLIRSYEGRDYVDKIFQLKLSLPPKEESEIKQYIEMLASSLPPKESQLITDGCPANPRKIKRILNLVYFLSTVTQENFEEYFPLIIIWSIATTIFPKLAEVIKYNTNSLVQMSLIINHLTDYEVLLRKIDNIKKVIPENTNVVVGSLPISYKYINQYTVNGLEYVANNNPAAFNFLKAVAKYYSIWVQNEKEQNLESTLEKNYNAIGTLLSDIIYKAGLIG